MSYFDYKTGQQIEMQEHPFYALIQAAMRQADSDNLRMLSTCWPEVWEELQARHKAPGGVLPGDGTPSMVSMWIAAGDSTG